MIRPTTTLYKAQVKQARVAGTNRKYTDERTDGERGDPKKTTTDTHNGSERLRHLVMLSRDTNRMTFPGHGCVSNPLVQC